MSSIKGQSVLITGGASGIGKLMGRMVLEEGAKLLIIWDINEAHLRETKAEFVARNFQIETFQVDVSDTSQVLSVFEKMKARLGPVDILINNAGIVIGKDFSQHTHEEIDRTMRVNTSAMMHISKAALSDMMQKNSGHIVNIASAAGMVSNPHMSVYCGSKWAVIGWSDSLRLELEGLHSGVHVTTVTPYYISTGMFAGVKSPFIPILKPEPTARKIIEAIKKDKIFLRLPLIVNLLTLVKGLLPTRLFDLVVGRGLAIYKTMETFKGRRP